MNWVRTARRARDSYVCTNNDTRAFIELIRDIYRGRTVRRARDSNLCTNNDTRALIEPIRDIDRDRTVRRARVYSTHIMHGCL